MDQITFTQVVSRGCGIDVHQKEGVATVDSGGIKKTTRKFLTFTSSLTELSEWLLELGITHVAMVYGVRGGMINTVCAMLTIWLSLRYIYMFYQIKHRQYYDPEKPVSQAGYFPDMDDEEYKYEKIYSQIEEYFKTEQPYLNACFSLSKLSNDLNINHAYLSKAISRKKSINFNSFVNSYRIAKVKELIRENPQYTLEHIYLTSGFNNHVSFNSAFKAVEKVTPSEYRRLLAEKKNITT